METHSHNRPQIRKFYRAYHDLISNNDVPNI